MTRRLLALAAASAAAGWLVDRAWAPLGLPSEGAPGDAPFPDVWRGVLAVAWAVLFPAFSAAHAGLPGAAGAAGRRWDRWSYVLLPAPLLVMAGARLLGHWRAALAALFVGVLFAKTLLLIVTLYRGFVAEEPEACPRARLASLGVAAFLLYGLLAPYVITAVSAGGDEPVYLLNVASLATDGDLAIRNNVERGDFARFFWGTPAPAFWTREFPGFAALLLPGYAAAAALLPDYPPAGRLGATLTIALCAALALAQLYALCRDLGIPRPAAVWAWLVTLLSPAVVVHASHVYPEIPASLLVVVGVRAVLRLPERVGPRLATVTGTAVALVLLKDRYAPLALGLLVWALARLDRRRRAGALALGGGLVAVGLWISRADSVSLVLVPGLGWPSEGLAALVGLFADQEVGLWVYAPHGLLAVVGVPLLWRRRGDAAFGLLGLVAAYLLLLVTHRWTWWHGGFTPPPRMILPVTVLLAPFLAEAFHRCRGPGLAAVNTVALTWSAAIALALALVPAWRYQNLDGRATLLQAAGALLGLDLARFWPSLIAPTPWTWAVLALGALALLGATLGAGRRFARPAPGWGAGAVWLGPRAGLGLVAALALAWIAAAALVPTWVVEAAAMRSTGGRQYQAREDSRARWAMTVDGELAERIVTWAGLTEVVVVAGSYTTTEAPPRLVVLLDDRPVAAWALPAGSGRWTRGEYTARVPTRFAHPRLRVRLAGLVDDAARGRFEHAYVERVHLRWLGGAP